MRIFRDNVPAAGTFSKDQRSFWGNDESDNLPQFITSGNHQYVYDQNGKEYIDWICALGANMLGYNYDGFNEALEKQLSRGVSFSLPTYGEGYVAQQLNTIMSERVPGWKNVQLMTRFTKTGTECTTAAVRLARAVTGRDLILRCSDSYLGWGDWTIATTPPARGVPTSYTTDTRLFKFNQEPNTFLQNGEQAACVILEQGLTEPVDGWYSRLRKWCDSAGTLLILDETASGFRYGLGGAAALYGVEPDLVTYGKALGNGLPISALVGPANYMGAFGDLSPVFVSGTFCGDALSLAAASFVLNLLSKNEKEVYDKMYAIGKHLRDGMIKVFEGTPYKVLGHPQRFIVQWPSDNHHAYFIRGMAARGILMNRPNYVNLSHTLYDADLTLIAAGGVIHDMTDEKVASLTSDQLPRVLFRNR